jgi:hypothetical protein
VRRDECISAQGFPRAPLAALEYFGGYKVDAKPETPPEICPVMLVQGHEKPPPGWHLVAVERRPTDRYELTAVYRR